MKGSFCILKCTCICQNGLFNHILYSYFIHHESKVPNLYLASFLAFLAGTSCVLDLVAVDSSCRLRYLPTPSLNTFRGCVEAFLGLTPGPSASAFRFNSSALSTASCIKEIYGLGCRHNSSGVHWTLGR